SERGAKVPRYLEKCWFREVYTNEKIEITSRIRLFYVSAIQLNISSVVRVSHRFKGRETVVPFLRINQNIKGTIFNVELHNITRLNRRQRASHCRLWRNMQNTCAVAGA